MAIEKARPGGLERLGRRRRAAAVLPQPGFLLHHAQAGRRQQGCIRRRCPRGRSRNPAVLLPPGSLLHHRQPRRRLQRGLRASRGRGGGPTVPRHTRLKCATFKGFSFAETLVFC